MIVSLTSAQGASVRSSSMLMEAFMSLHTVDCTPPTYHILHRCDTMPWDTNIVELDSMPGVAVMARSMYVDMPGDALVTSLDGRGLKYCPYCGTRLYAESDSEEV